MSFMEVWKPEDYNIFSQSFITQNTSEESMKEKVTSFSNDDMDGVEYFQIVTVFIVNKTVKKNLVDNRSSVDVLYCNIFKEKHYQLTPLLDSVRIFWS